ncbi:MAG: chemotaxis-specific protein-glutamate methyltransferase CheB [Cyanobacteria bacterium J06554_3]
MRTSRGERNADGTIDVTVSGTAGGEAASVIKVAIANDTSIALEALRRVIASTPDYQLIWTAKNGAEAVALCAQQRPDVVLMDLLMPTMDGVEATRQIMLRSPCAILIVTASPAQNTSKVFEAMGHGALDVVATPSLSRDRTVPLGEMAQPLLAKMKTIAVYTGRGLRYRRQPPVNLVPAPTAPAPALPDLIVIGASTGGPRAIAKILSAIAPSCPAAIVIVQHINQQFAAGLASWLTRQSSLPVKLIKPGDVMHSGTVLVAATDEHLVMRCDRTLTYTRTDRHTPYRPSVDVFFESVAAHWPQPGQAVLLTGMGRDGAEGMSTLRAAGWQTIAESQDSCVVYGMPRAAIEYGAANAVLPVSQIASALEQGWT